jgi:hypothetical protein
MAIISIKPSLFRNIVLCTSFILLFACNNTHTHTTTEKKYTFKLHLQTGAKYYYTIHNETDVNLSIKDNKVENKNNITVGLIYNINKDSAGNDLFKITFDSFAVVLKNGNKETNLTTANGGEYSLDPTERMLASLKDNSIFVTADANGRIISVSGYKEIADKLVSEMNITNETERNQVEGQISSMAGEGFVKNNLAQSFNIFPDSALYVGDSWTKELTASTQLGLDLPTVYTLYSVDNNVATIKSASDINTSNQNININGTQAAATLKGNEEGKLRLELNTGMILQADSKVSIKGNIEVMGSEVPVSIKISKQVTAKKL